MPQWPSAPARPLGWSGQLRHRRCRRPASAGRIRRAAVALPEFGCRWHGPGGSSPGRSWQCGASCRAAWLRGCP